MPTRDKRIDAYIVHAAPFARPILTHLRQVVHAACPEVEETIKWGMPFFMHGGILCWMAAFKQHATFGLWKQSKLAGQGARATEAMGQFGRLTDVKQLPTKRALTGYIRQAMRLAEEHAVAPPKPRGKARPAPTLPADLRTALGRNTRAKATFAAFPPGQRREYVEWIIEAKQAATRARRVATAVEWLSEGKRRNWKYENC